MKQGFKCLHLRGNTWVFPKLGVPQNGWFIMENPIKMDDLGVPLFLETPIFGNTHIGSILDLLMKKYGRCSTKFDLEELR